jgi:hypothetical protein
MHHVLGYDTAGRELFSVDVEAIDEQDAKLIALRELRRTPDGVHKANQAQDLVVLLDWRCWSSNVPPTLLARADEVIE